MSAASEIHYTTSADGTEIGYTVQGVGPSLVITHGSVGTMSQWQAVITELSNTFTCYVYDRRGRGLSGDAGEYSLNAEIADLQAMLAVACPGSRVLAHSYGGLIALQHALAHGVAKQLILFEPPLSLNRLVAGDALAPYREAIAAGDNDRALRIALEQIVGLTATEVAGVSQSPLWPELRELAPTWSRELAAIDGLGMDHGRYSGLPAGQLEFLVGGATTTMLAAATRKLHELLPAAGVTTMAGLHHFSHVTEPTELADHICQVAGRH